MANIKRGDTVQVIAGKDKGVKGTVLEVNKKDQRVVVEGANRVKRHTKETESERGAKVGGIITVEAPIHISNLVYLHKGTPTRVGRKVEGSKIVRFAKKSGEVIK